MATAKQRTDTLVRQVERDLAAQAEAQSGDAARRPEPASEMVQTVGSPAWRAWIAKRSPGAREEDRR